MIPYSEWLLLLILAVVLLKPEEIPVLAKSLGIFVRYFSKIWQKVIIGNATDVLNHSNHKKHPFYVAPLGAKIQPIKN